MGADETDASGRLAGAFAAASPTEARAHYAEWAKWYDGENLARGLRVAPVGAAAYLRYARLDGPILDAACGTGLVAETLGILGVGPLIGCDFSAEMLALAAARGRYGALHVADLTALPYPEDAFAGWLCMGAFGPGHAPPTSLAELARVMRPGGIGVFNLREDTFEAQGFGAALRSLTEGGRFEIAFESTPFTSYLLAEPDLMSRLFVLRAL